MKRFNILVAEDEKKVAAFIKKGLEENEYSVEIATDGDSGLKMLLAKDYDLAILDIGLPFLLGYDVCKKVKQAKPVLPILMLTAYGTIESKLNGFDAGADDYLVKPFEFKELLARMKALLRRVGREHNDLNVLRIADLELNTDSKEVIRGGKQIELTVKEFMLLEYFIRNKNRVISRSEIIEKIWDIKFDTGTNITDVYINFLRKKVDNDFQVKLIHTHFGIGYILKG